MSLASRLLGLAFASADALIEIDKHGVVRFALGAGPNANMPIAHWVGHALSDRLSAETAAKLKSAFDELPNGQRSKNVEIEVDCGNGRYRKAQLSAFRLPELAPALSCALTYTAFSGPVVAIPVPRRAIHGARDLQAHLSERLNAETAATLQNMALAFVDISGMDDLAESQRSTLNDSIAGILQAASFDGNSAGRLSDKRYALVCNQDKGETIAEQLSEMGSAHGCSISARTGTSPIGADPAAALRAMRFAIEACLRDPHMLAPEQGFAETLSRTLKDAERFRAMVQNKEFSLFYQPIVDLKTRTIHHYEGLSRFPNTTGPAAAIRMAEELALIESFDRTVAEMAIQRMKQSASKNMSLAINVSGVSMASDTYVTHLLALTASEPALRSRLLIEVTETAALADLVSANRRLTALRASGIRVCIDDFGAGSASFDYLRGLNVDIVKIDGSLVRGVGTDARARTMISHLVDLCSALGIDTVAEMVETEDQAAALMHLGVSHAQGWLFGRAETEPRTRIDSTPSVARRRGTVSSWS